MKKELNIDLYNDGYFTKDINCIDIPIAGCCGNFSHNYYFYYLMCYSIMINWICPKEQKWFERHKSITKLLDIEMSEKILCEDNICESIKENLEKEAPVLLVVKYGALPYSRYYKEGTYDHGLIVSGYDNQKMIFHIQDRELTRRYIESKFFNCDILFGQWITLEYLEDIIIQSNKIHKAEGSLYYRKMYTFEKISNNNLEIDYVIENIKKLYFSHFNNNLKYFILECNECIKGLGQITQSDMESRRRDSVRSFSVLKDVLYRFYDKYVKISPILEDFISFRLTLMNRIYKNLLLQKPFTSYEDIEKDQKLFETFIKKL